MCTSRWFDFARTRFVTGGRLGGRAAEEGGEESSSSSSSSSSAADKAEIEGAEKGTNDVAEREEGDRDERRERGDERCVLA